MAIPPDEGRLSVFLPLFCVEITVFQVTRANCRGIILTNEGSTHL